MNSLTGTLSEWADFTLGCSVMELQAHFLICCFSPRFPAPHPGLSVWGSIKLCPEASRPTFKSSSSDNSLSLVRGQNPLVNIAQGSRRQSLNGWLGQKFWKQILISLKIIPCYCQNNPSETNLNTITFLLRILPAFWIHIEESLFSFAKHEDPLWFDMRA